MTTTHFLLLLLVTVVLLLISCQLMSNNSNMTDLSKEEIIQLYEKYSGKKVTSPDDFCVEQAPSFKGVYSLGWFANDRGCMGNEILVEKTIGERNTLTQKALELNGWKDKSKQQELALKWAEEVILAWSSPLTSSNEHFKLDSTPTFEEPTCVAESSGWKVTFWVQKPSGMRPQADYYQLEVVFDAAGNVLKQNNINSFYVEY